MNRHYTPSHTYTPAPTRTPSQPKPSPYDMVKALESYFTVHMNSDEYGIRYRVACTLVAQALRGIKVFM